MTQDEADTEAAQLTPLDRQPIRTYYPPELAGAAVSVFFSPSLVDRFSEDVWGPDGQGIFSVVAVTTGEEVTRLVILLNDPVTELQVTPTPAATRDAADAGRHPLTVVTPRLWLACGPGTSQGRCGFPRRRE